MFITDFNKVEALAPMTGANSGTVFTDVSLRKRTIIRTGAVTSTAQSKFAAYGSSGLFSGTSQLISITAADHIVGNGDFFVGLWLYPTSVSGFSNVIGQRVTSNFGPFTLVLDSGKARLRMSQNGTTWGVDVTGGTTLSTNTWTYVSFSRLGTSVKVHVNGTLDITPVTVTGNLMTPAANVHVGAESGGASAFAGHMQDLIIVKGDALFSGNFTPPGRLAERTLTRSSTGTDSHEYDRAALFDWNVGSGNGLSTSVTPDSEGDFVASDLIDLEYGVAFIKDGCGPICRGPVEVDPDA
jgi:hypothetical protein